MKKLRNVLNGHRVHDVIDNINIINVEKMEVMFCGALYSFLNPPDFMECFRDELMNMNVKKSDVNGARLDIFI